MAHVRPEDKRQEKQGAAYDYFGKGGGELLDRRDGLRAAGVSAAAGGDGQVVGGETQLDVPPPRTKQLVSNTLGSSEAAFIMASRIRPVTLSASIALDDSS